jgi:uncharacterized protein
MNTIWLAFITGLTTGGISCMAVQGGLLASSLSGEPDENGEATKVTGLAKWAQVTVFILTKFTAYAVLGGILGAIGSSLLLSPKTLGMVQIAVGLFMLATAARIANIHPIFRYFVIQPPKSVYKLLRRTSKSGLFFAPALLGFFTILMPCGVTQAMMAVAVASGSAAMGAAIMGAFVLGTSPLFFALGATIVELLQRKAFAIVAAIVIAILGVISINGGLGLRGSFYTLQNVWKAATIDPASLATKEGTVAGVNNNGEQKATITVTSGGYSSDVSTLKVNVPVRLTLKSVNAAGCGRSFTIPDLNISKVLPVNGEDEITFTPKKTGRLAYSCSMGMYTGEFTIIN